MNGTQTTNDDESTLPAKPVVSRRDVMRAAAAGGAATVLPTSVLADHGSDDPIDVSDDQDASGDGEDAVRPARVAAGSAAGGALVAGPAGAVAGAALGYTTGVAADAIGDWLFGSFEDRIDTQLQVDIHSHATTVYNENAWNLQQFDTRLSLGQNNWIAQAQFDVIQTMQELNVDNTTSTSTETATETPTSTETTTSTDSTTDREETINAGVNGVLEASASPHESLLAIETATTLRYAGFDAREDVAEIADSDKVTHPLALGKTSDQNTVLGVKPIHINLLNGETVESWALHAETTMGADNELTEIVVHSHAVDEPLVGTSDPDLPTDATRMYELVEEFEYSGSGYVEYVDPDTGDRITTGSIDGTDSLRVKHPEGTGEDVLVLDSADIDPLHGWSADSPGGLNAYWHDHFYPLISVLCSEIETYAGDVFDSVNAGEIAIDELITPSIFAEELARDWSESGDTGMSRELLANLGVDTDLQTSMTIQVSDTDSPSTVITEADKGVADAFDHSLAEASESVSVVLAYGPETAKNDAGDVLVPGDASPVIGIEVAPFTDDTESPSYVVKSIDVTTAGGTTASARVADSGDGSTALGEVWHDDLASSGSYTIDSIDVTYSTSDGSEFTETVASPGQVVNIDPGGVAWEFENAALATDWRPHGGVPEDWSETIRDETVFEGVTMSEVSGTVDVLIGFDHDGSTDGESTYTVPETEAVSVSLLVGDTADVTAVTLTTEAGGTHTVDLSSDTGGSVGHSEILPDGADQYTITDVTVEYADGSGGTATTTAGSLGKTLIPEDVEIPEFDFLVGQWYNTGNASSEDTIVINTQDGEWVDVQPGEHFKITSATDVDGNEKDGVTLSDTNRHTLDPTRVEEEVRRSVELQKESEGGGAGAGGGDGGDGMGLGALGIAAGGIGAAYLYVKSKAGR